MPSMKSLRTPDGTDKEKVYPLQLRNMTVDGTYYYVTTFDVLAKAVALEGSDFGFQRVLPDGDTPVVVMGRSATGWNWTTI